MNIIEDTEKIYVSKPFLPPRREYDAYLDLIWKDCRVTNHGPLSDILKKQLETFLGIQQLTLINNGTQALQIAIKALALHGEVITTPFSHVSTTSALLWEGITPVFADIDPDTLNISPDTIEKCITQHTTGILATHIFGNPCDVDRIAKIAKKYQLKILYDCAHAFNVSINNQPITDHGDASIFSFHGTKMFHTVEGGGIVSKHQDIYQRASYMSNFGLNGQENFFGVGVNGKIDEFRSAMGLCILPYVSEHTLLRQKIYELYRSYFEGQCNIRIVNFSSPQVVMNYSYFPVIFKDEMLLLKVKQCLEAEKIYPRRYFYPALTQLPYLDPPGSGRCPIAEDIASRILCLPLYASLNVESVIKISEIILNETIS